MKTRPLFIILFLIALLCIALKDGVGFIFSIFFTILIYILVCGETEDKRFIAMVFMLAFFARVVLAYAFHMKAYNDGFGGFLFGDDRLYSLRALKMSLIWRHLPYNTIADVSGESYGANPFTTILALYYRFFDPNYFDSKMINCLIGSVTPLFVYYIGRKLFSPV